MNEQLTYHNDQARSGLNHDFSFHMGAGWRRVGPVTLPTRSGVPSSVHPTVRGAVLLVKDWLFSTGPQAGRTHNLVIVATCDNQIYGFAEEFLLNWGTTPLWQTTLPLTQLAATGTNMQTIGVCGTPVADPANGRVFVLAMHDDGTGKGAFTIFSLNLDSGAILQKAQLVDTVVPGRPTFVGDGQDQRGGLNLVGGRVYACFGARFAFDNSNPPFTGVYFGWVVACTANNLAEQLFLPVTSTATVSGGGIWSQGGAVAAPDDTLYVATGNGVGTDNNYWAQNPHPGDVGDFFMAVIRVGVTFNGPVAALAVLDWYQPGNAQALDGNDCDFAGGSPIVLPPVIGQDGVNHELIALCPKDGNVYLINRKAMGHFAGQMFVAPFFDPCGGGIGGKCSPAFLRTTAGDNILYFSGMGGNGLLALRLTVTNATSATLTPAWPSAGRPVRGLSGNGGMPTVMANPGLSDVALVWIVDGASGGDRLQNPQVSAYNAITGDLVFTDNIPVDLPHFAPITCAGRSVFIGTHYGFVIYTQAPVKNIEKFPYPEKTWKFEKIELKDFVKYEIKENLKAEVDTKFIEWPPKLKDIEGGPAVGLTGDPYAAIGLLAARIDAIEQQLGIGKAFIRPEERPKTGGNVLRAEESRKEGERSETKRTDPKPEKRGRKR